MIKNDRYALMKRCNYDLQLQVYMYDLMYVNPETMAEENYFPATSIFFEDYKKMSNSGPVPKH